MRGSQIRNFSVIALVAIFWFLSGCNKTDWAVKWADTYLSWKIIDQFDFSGDSKKTVKEETSQMVHDFRHSKFPVLAQLFHRSALEAAHLDFKSPDIVQSWVNQKMDESEAFLNDLAPFLQPYANRIAALVEKDNWQSYLKSFEKENAKLLKNKSKCASKFEDELEDWMGDLTEFQKSAIEKYCVTRADSQEVRVRNRSYILQTFRAWAEPQGHFEKATFEAAVKRWVASYRRVQSSESEAKWKISRDELIRTFTQILLHADEAQKHKLATSLEERAKSFQKLAL